MAPHSNEFKTPLFFTIRSITTVRLTLLLSALLLQACSQLPFLASSADADIEQLLADKQFYSVLQIIDETAESDANYQRLQKRRPEVVAAIREYQQQTLSKTQKLINQGKWGASLNTLDDALQNLPGNNALLQKRQRVKVYIDDKLAPLNLALAEARAATLKQEVAAMQKMATFRGDANFTQQLKDRRQAIEGDHRALMIAAKRSYRNEDWQAAKNYAALAEQLKSQRDAQEILKKVDQYQVNTEVAELRQAINDNDLSKAQALADQLKKQAASKEIQGLIDGLDEKIAALVANLTEEGQQAYTAGNIDIAINRWQQAADLAPEDAELQKRLQRAKAFQENYRRLKGL